MPGCGGRGCAGWTRGALLRRHGRPIRYVYTERDQPLSAYQTVFALPGPEGVGSAEMPSAGRPFTARLVAELVARGVLFAPVSLHTGVASAEAHEPPYAERFAVPEPTAWLVNAVRARRRAAGGGAGGGSWRWARRRCGPWSPRPRRRGWCGPRRAGPIWW
ncbi:hypothetical protein GCM10020000_62890 [Streptomyces olivoverticillatus]